MLALLLLAVAQQPAAPPAVEVVAIASVSEQSGGAPNEVRLAQLGEDTLVASATLGGGPDGPPGSPMFWFSTDAGKSWKSGATLARWHAVAPFAVGGSLYAIGHDLDLAADTVAVARSTDQGRTWTKPVDERSGILRTRSVLRACESPAVISAGRVWRAFEAVVSPSGEEHRAALVLASAAVGSDLLDASSWTWSAPCPPEGAATRLLRRSRVAADGDRLPIVLMTTKREWTQYAAPTLDGAGMKPLDLDEPWKDCDALGPRLDRDVPSGLVPALGAFHDPSSSLGTRASEIALLVSRDRSAWDLRVVLVRGSSESYFSAGDWGVDRKDLVGVVASGTTSHGSHSLHFLRVREFAQRRYGEAPVPLQN